VKSVFDEIVEALIAPLTEKEKNPPFPEYDFSDLRFEGENYDEALEKFQTYFIDNGLTDGVSVAAPTKEAVERMLAGTSRRPDDVLGLMLPGYGFATVEKVAINAVMAGAKPEYMPVIIAAIELLCDPTQIFNKLHIFTSIVSTHMVIHVSGPIAKELGMNGKAGYLGAGNRANSAIGRAVSLCAINIGWLVFKNDNGMLGQPSRYCNLTFCENDEESPWESFAVSLGFDPEDSTVMVEEGMSLDGVFPMGRGALPSGIWTEGLKADLGMICEKVAGQSTPLNMLTISDCGNSVHDLTRAFMKSVEQLINKRTYVLVVYPGLARRLASEGYTREKLAEYIRNHNRIPWDEFLEEWKPELLKLAKSGTIPGFTEDDCKSGGSVPIFNTDGLAILVAGAMSGQTLGIGLQGKRIERGYLDPGECKFNIKKITGATLTKAGR
jgi:hypothetical protein